MRTLKFRLWSNSQNKYVDGTFMIVSTEGELFSLDEAYVLEQYTGLKDKNGKEIYEGDIVLDDDFGDVGMVEYYAPNFTFHPIYPIERWNSHYIGMYMKVIGNIHENPELLGEEA